MNNIRNFVQLIGRVGKDVELKIFDQGKTLARITIATNDYYKNNRGEKVQETQWHNCIAWGKTAELMESMLSKGSEVIVSGKLTHRSYEDKEGKTRYSTEVVISEFMALSKKEAAVSA